MRAPHTLGGQQLKFSLDQERGTLAQEVGRTSAGRTAKTLAKSDTLRVILIQVQGGTTIHPAATAGAASIQVLEGRLSVDGGQSSTSELRAGDLLVLPDNLREPIRAVDTSTLLVTIAWAEGAGAWDEEEQEGKH